MACWSRTLKKRNKCSSNAIVTEPQYLALCWGPCPVEGPFLCEHGLEWVIGSWQRTQGWPGQRTCHLSQRSWPSYCWRRRRRQMTRYWPTETCETAQEFCDTIIFTFDLFNEEIFLGGGNSTVSVHHIPRLVGSGTGPGEWGGGGTGFWAGARITAATYAAAHCSPAGETDRKRETETQWNVGMNRLLQVTDLVQSDEWWLTSDSVRKVT